MENLGKLKQRLLLDSVVCVTAGDRGLLPEALDLRPLQLRLPISLSHPGCDSRRPCALHELSGALVAVKLKMSSESGLFLACFYVSQGP